MWLKNHFLSLKHASTEWLRLFLVYASVYLQAFPSESAEVITYIANFLDLANEGGFLWREYDIKFRTVRAFGPSSLPLGRFNWELLSELRHQQFLTPESMQPACHPCPAVSRSTTSLYPRGACWAYLSTGSCSRTKCQYTHYCTNCSSIDHSFLECKEPNDSAPLD